MLQAFVFLPFKPLQEGGDAGAGDGQVGEGGKALGGGDLESAAVQFGDGAYGGKGDDTAPGDAEKLCRVQLGLE